MTNRKEWTIKKAFEEEFLEHVEFKTLREVYDFPFDELEEDGDSWEAPDKPEPPPASQPQEKKDDFTFRVHFNRGVLWTEYQKKLLKKFMPFVRKVLQIKNPVEIYLLNKRKGDMTTGAFEVEDEKMYILAKHRHHVDVFRSIAHETIHLKQKEMKKIGGEKQREDIPDVGGEIEDEANSLAGQIIKKFAEKVGKEKLFDVIGDEHQYEEFR